MDIRSHEIRNITITPEILKLIAEIDEFKGRWKVMESLAPQKAHQPEADCHDRECWLLNPY